MQICQEGGEAVVPCAVCGSTNSCNCNEAPTPTRRSRWFGRPAAVAEALEDEGPLLLPDSECSSSDCGLKAPAHVQPQLTRTCVLPHSSAFDCEEEHPLFRTAGAAGLCSTAAAATAGRSRRVGEAVGEAVDATSSGDSGSNGADALQDEDDSASVAPSAASEARSFVSVSDRIAFFERSRQSNSGGSVSGLDRTTSDHTADLAYIAHSTAQRGTARHSLDDTRSMSAPLLPLVRLESPFPFPPGVSSWAQEGLPNDEMAVERTPRGVTSGASLPPRHAVMQPGAFGSAPEFPNPDSQHLDSPLRTTQPLTAAALHAQHALRTRVELDESPAAPAAMQRWHEEELQAGYFESPRAVHAPHAFHASSPRSPLASLPGSGTAADAAAMHARRAFSPERRGMRGREHVVHDTSSEGSGTSVGADCDW